MSIIIEATNLGKKYSISHQKQGRYLTLRDSMMQAARTLGRSIRHPFSANSEKTDIEEFWALRDINFEIRQGDRVGIIGRNGAGKSTLLKILSRITEPTTGRVLIRGRVASLLEVGTGFHPELTGRENVFLNGAILGMTRQEIRKKFDEIVAFAEVEKFLDTPVKRFSSGMYVRLAFAVAAHLEPEILLVDEVLAVGDIQFQKKCLGKMGEVSQEGRTVLFVSHNMQAVRKLCTAGFVLKSGNIKYAGTSSEAVDFYLQHYVENTSSVSISSLISNLTPDPVFRFKNIAITQDDTPVEIIDSGKALHIAIEYLVYIKTTGLRVYFDLCDMDENILFRSFHDETYDGIQAVEPGHYISQAVIPENFLAPTTYDLRIRGTIHNVRTFEPKDGICIRLSVEKAGLSNKAYLAEPIRGKLAPLIAWKTDIST